MKFRFLTAGESHGKCLTAIIEGVPAGIEIDEDLINRELSLRQEGYGRGGRMKIEKDTVEIKSGVRFGVSTGAPICLEIENKDWSNWKIPMATGKINLEDGEISAIVESKKITKVRPGHADLSGALKYNHEDIRNILERSSARETAARTAVGAVAKCILKEFGITSTTQILQIGTQTQANEIKQEIDKAKELGDTLGGSFAVVVSNVPVGLGSFVHWDKRLDGNLAKAVMSIPAIKAVEIGAGMEAATLPGSKMQDEITYEGAYRRKTNNAGGIEGGMTNGEPIVVKAAMKPIPTMRKPLNSVEIDSHKAIEAHFERSDTSAVEACAVVADAMISIVIADSLLEKFGGDSLKELKNNFENYAKLISQR